MPSPIGAPLSGHGPRAHPPEHFGGNGAEPNFGTVGGGVVGIGIIGAA